MGLTEFVNVVLERLVAKQTPPLVAKCDCGLPRCLFRCRWSSLIKRENVIPTLDHSDVRQKSTNRVAGTILQLIQFSNAQPLDGCEGRVARVE